MTQLLGTHDGRFTPERQGVGEMDVARRDVLAWGRAHGRRFQWRDNTSVYCLAVAEILLQKTKGPDVEGVWEHFLSAYPSPWELRDAPEDDVRGLVGKLGLGKQRTSRLKRMAAGLIEGIYPLPGLGTYGTGVLDLSSGRRPTRPPIDGNVARVLQRWIGMTIDRGEPRKNKVIVQLMSELLAMTTRPGEGLALLYGLVDLGAEVCKPRAPFCISCPLRTTCPRGRVGMAAASAVASGGGTASDT